MLACRPFRKLWKASKCFGEVNKTKISLTYHSINEAQSQMDNFVANSFF